MVLTEAEEIELSKAKIIELVDGRPLKMPNEYKIGGWSDFSNIMNGKPEIKSAISIVHKGRDLIIGILKTHNKSFKVISYR
jgi:hypothetical protein